MGRLFLAFVLFALTELYVLLALGRALGFWPTLALLFVTSVVGTVIARSLGARVLLRWSEALAGGQMPEEGVLGGVLVLMGSALLIVPGVLSDVLGLSLLIPGTRALWARGVRTWLERRVARGDVEVVTMGTVSMGGPGMRARAGRPGTRPVAGVIDVEGHEVSRSDAPPPTLERGDE